MATFDRRSGDGGGVHDAQPGTSGGRPAREQLRREIAGLPYAQQLERLKPPVPMRSAVQTSSAPGGEQLAAEQWSRAHDAACASFHDVADAIVRGVEGYREMLSQNDPPRGWAALAPLAEWVTNAVFGRLGERLLSSIGADSTKNLLTHALRQASKDASKAAKEAIGDLVSSTAEQSVDAVKRAFLFHQSGVLLEGISDAREAFRDSAGLPSAPVLELAQLEEVEQTNRAFAFDRTAASELVFRELTVGWCNMLAADQSESGDSERWDAPGVLRLVIAGRRDEPTEIQRATLFGAGPAVREQMGGMPLGQWLGQRGEHGLTITIRTGDFSFQASPEAREAMIVRGVVPERDLRGVAEPYIYFSFAVLPGGTIRRDEAPHGGRDGQASAGSWFIEHVPPRELLETLRGLPLPRVEAL